MSESLKVVIFGASGQTGKNLVSQALETGYQVTAFVRNRDKLQITHDSLSVISGDVLKKKDVNKAVAKQDAVLSALGVKPGQTPICTEAIKNIISAMKKHKVSRLVVESAYGTADSKRGFYGTLLGFMLKAVMQDKAEMETVIAESDLDWVVVRPTMLTNRPETDNYQTGEGIAVSFFPKISRADVAAFMLNCVTDKKHLKKRPTITT